MHPKRWAAACTLVLAFATGRALAAAIPGPVWDHHQHLLSPAAARLLRASAPRPAPPHLPAPIALLLRQRGDAWNRPRDLAPLYTEDALVTEADIMQGRAAVSDFVGTRFARAYALKPVALSETSAEARVAIDYTREVAGKDEAFGSALLTLKKDAAGQWQIASEAMRFPAAPSTEPLDAAQLVQLLDEAEVQHAVVLSVAYFFESPLMPAGPDAAAQLRAENDWTAAEVARFPQRLIGFCSVNPLTDTALPEIRRCARTLHLRGLKLHFGNSGVDVTRPDHVAKVQRVFAEANRWRLPIAVHLWTGPEYGRKQAEIFLERILPQAPDVTVQIAHLAGGGPGWTDEALQVFASAIRDRNPAVRRVCFDVATVADSQSPAQRRLLARRLREIGLGRILFGSDAAFGGRSTPEVEWGTFRGMVPLTDAEFATIRSNRAPYLP